MPFSINPDLIENNDVEIQTEDGELALFHKPSGNTLIIDEDTSVSEKLQSPLSDDVDFDGNDLNSGGDAEFTALEAESVSTAEIQTKMIGANDYHYAGDYAGGDPDSRLDNAISAASVGDTIYLENDVYSSDRTTDKRLEICGTGGYLGDGTDIEAEWSLDRGIYHGFSIREKLTITGTFTRVFNIGLNSAAIDIDANRVVMSGLTSTGNDSVVTFLSDTSDGIIDASSVEGGVTDNGSNTVGDIA